MGLLEAFVPKLSQLRLQNDLQQFILKKVANKQNVFSDVELYQILAEHPTHAKLILQYMDQSLKPDAIEKFIAEYPKFWPLLAHPGIANHKEKFFNFVTNNQFRLNKLDYVQIIKEFEKEFELVRVFRGISLTSRELEKIKVEGIAPPLFLYQEKYVLQNIQSIFFISEYSNLRTLQYGGLRQQIENRTKVEPTLTQSLSEYFEVAANVGHRFRLNKDETAKTYVFEIHIPSLYLSGGRFSHAPSPFMRAGERVYRDKKAFKVGDQLFPPQVEAFIFDTIEKRFIVNAVVPDEKLVNAKSEFVD